MRRRNEKKPTENARETSQILIAAYRVNRSYLPICVAGAHFPLGRRLPLHFDAIGTQIGGAGTIQCIKIYTTQCVLISIADTTI